MNKIQKLLIQNIKNARSKLGYSQLKFAEKCNISPGFVGEIESGKKFPSSNTLLKISEALGLEPYQLFTDVNKKENYEQFDLVTKLYNELKENINKEIERTIKKYLS